jgi:hypothetical protein
MTTIAILFLVIYPLSVLYALSKGCDVKAALKIPFIAFTFETNGNKKIESGVKPILVAPDKSGGSS